MPKIAMFVLAAAVTAGVSAPTAHAAHSRIQFLSPSGDVGCQMGTAPSGVAFARCTADQHSWAAAESDVCFDAAGGDDVALAEGEAPCVGTGMSPLFFTGHSAPPSLNRGDQRSVGSITCTVEAAGVSCGDSTTGNGFRVSRERYQLT